MTKICYHYDQNTNEYWSLFGRYQECHVHYSTCKGYGVNKNFKFMVRVTLHLDNGCRGKFPYRKQSLLF